MSVRFEDDLFLAAALACAFGLRSCAGFIPSRRAMRLPRLSSLVGRGGDGVALAPSVSFSKLYVMWCNGYDHKLVLTVANNLRS